MNKGKIIFIFGGVALLGIVAYYLYKRSKEKVVYQVGNFEIIKTEE